MRFADRVEEEAAPQLAAAFDYSKFRHPPDHLLTLALKQGWTQSPENTMEAQNAV